MHTYIVLRKASAAHLQNPSKIPIVLQGTIRIKRKSEYKSKRKSKKELSKTAYQLECISKGFEQLRKGLITESEFKKLIADAGLTYDMIDELTDSIWGKFYFSPDIAAYIKAKGLLDEQ